ncbi:MAG TPA: Ppx/GppA family phosphatase [Rhodospirillales bacterium]|nr:Ppx/GppA family phosphatase [Rhodospirillales bacterium]
MAQRKGEGKTRNGRPLGAARQAPAYAAIDLGSSNCRMLMAKPSHGGFNVVGSFSRIVRLAEGLSDHGRLGDAAMNRTIDALKVCAGKIGQWKAPKIRAVATEACRRAANRREFTARVKAETGIVVETISAERESKLTVAGCAPLLNGGAPYALIFDIGGGSTELMWIETAPGKAPRLLDALSIPFGVVALAERFGDDAISAEDYAHMMHIPDESLSAFDAKHAISRKIAEDKVRALGTSGTVTMLGGIYLDLPRYNRAKVDGLDMDTAGVLANAARLARMTCKERAAISCIGRARAELAVGGCAFLEAILRRWPVRKLRAADRGIREGLLLSMMSEDGALSTDAG